MACPTHSTPVATVPAGRAPMMITLGGQQARLSRPDYAAPRQMHATPDAVSGTVHSKGAACCKLHVQHRHRSKPEDCFRDLCNARAALQV